MGGESLTTCDLVVDGLQFVREYSSRRSGIDGRFTALLLWYTAVQLPRVITKGRS